LRGCGGGTGGWVETAFLKIFFGLALCSLIPNSYNIQWLVLVFKKYTSNSFNMNDMSLGGIHG